MRPWSFLLAVASFTVGCGDAFTQAAGGPVDAGPADGSLGGHDSAPTDDSSTPADAGADDAKGDAPMSSDASSGCGGTCQTGFECILGFCVDDATTHFSATMNPSGNWTYGSETSLNGAYTPYLLHDQMAGNLAVWDSTASTLTPSIFFNGSTTSESFPGFTMAAKSLGFAPTPPLSGSSAPPTPVSVLRWTCPATGHYAIDAVFTGLAPSNMTTVVVGVFVNGAVIGTMQSEALNVESGMNTFVYSQPAIAMNAGALVDFYVDATMSNVWISGYTGIDAHLTGR